MWAYDVSAEHVAAINRDGLRVGDAVVRIAARTDAREIPPCDYGVVATKAMLTEAALAATAHVFADAAVCSLQNGIGSEEAIARARAAGDPRRDDGLRPRDSRPA